MLKTRFQQEYYSRIVPQLVSILMSPQPSGPPSPLLQATIHVLTRMAPSHPKLAQRLVVAPICGGLWQWWGYVPEDEAILPAHDAAQTADGSDTTFDEILLSESSLNRTLAVLQI